MRVIRHNAFAATPWKNGGGITREAIRMPACGDPFLWRVSVAEIDRSGPFSDFSGYQRKMALLRGNGLHLAFDGGASATLRNAGELIEFDGATATQCDLIDGSCVDLNLMVRNGVSVGVRVHQLDVPLSLSVAPQDTLLIFPLGGSISVTGAAGAGCELAAWDLAVASDEGCSLARSLKSSAPTAVFLATIGA